MRDPLPIGRKASGIMIFWTLIGRFEEYHGERSQVYVWLFETRLVAGAHKICTGTYAVCTFDQLSGFPPSLPGKNPCWQGSWNGVLW